MAKAVVTRLLGFPPTPNRDAPTLKPKNHYNTGINNVKKNSTHWEKKLTQDSRTGARAVEGRSCECMEEMAALVIYS